MMGPITCNLAASTVCYPSFNEGKHLSYPLFTGHTADVNTLYFIYLKQLGIYLFTYNDESL